MPALRTASTDNGSKAGLMTRSLRGPHRAEGGVQRVPGAPGLEGGAEVLGGAAQEGIGHIAGAVEHEVGAVQAGHAAQQPEGPQVPHLRHSLALSVSTLMVSWNVYKI